MEEEEDKHKEKVRRRRIAWDRDAGAEDEKLIR